MAANGRPLDKYAQRRRAELAAQRKAGHRAPRRPPARPTAPDAMPVHVVYARALLPILQRAWSPLPEPSHHRTRWTYEQDMTLVRYYADGLSATEVAAVLRQAVRQCATPGGCERRIRALWRMYRPGVPA